MCARGLIQNAGNNCNIILWKKKKDFFLFLHFSIPLTACRAVLHENTDTDNYESKYKLEKLNCEFREGLETPSSIYFAYDYDLYM